MSAAAVYDSACSLQLLLSEAISYRCLPDCQRGGGIICSNKRHHVRDKRQESPCATSFSHDKHRQLFLWTNRSLFTLNFDVFWHSSSSAICMNPFKQPSERQRRWMLTESFPWPAASWWDRDSPDWLAVRTGLQRCTNLTYILHSHSISTYGRGGRSQYMCVWGAGYKSLAYGAVELH